MPKQERYRHGDTWFDAITTVFPNGQRLKEAGKAAVAAYGDLLTVPPVAIDISHELHKTTEEELCIRACATALNSYLEARSLPPLNLLPERIHVLPPSHPVWPEFNAEGLVSHGRIYLPRQPNATSALLILTHEAAHVAAFTELVSTIAGNEADGYRVEEMAVRRSGMAYCYRSRKQNHPGYGFKALNEAVTEMVAHQLRLCLPADSQLERIACYEDLHTCAIHWASLELVDALCRKLGHSPAERTLVRRMLVRDYLTGSRDFMRLLSKKQPGAVRRLHRLEPEPSQLAVAADGLGFTNLATRIRDQYGKLGL